MRKGFLDLTKEELITKLDWHKDKNIKPPVEIIERLKELDPANAVSYQQIFDSIS